MAQIKPIDLKKIAKRFTEEFYPDWVSRFDRIWAMFEKIDPDSIPTGLDKLQPRLGNAFGITGMAEPESQECIGGIAVCAFTYKQVQDKSSVSEDEIRQKISIIPNFKITPSLQRKLEHVLAEMVPSMTYGVDEQTEKLKIEEDTTGYNKKASFAETYDYRIWYNDSEPSGLPIDISLKEKIVIKEKDKYDLFIIREEALTQIFINGNNSMAKPSKTGYRILTFSLKYRGNCGTAWNIAKHLYSIEEAEKFKDLREMAKAVKEQRKLKIALQDFKDEAGGIENYSNRVRGFVNSLNHDFLINVNTSIKANSMGEYELNPMIKYCLIEKS